MVHIYNSLTRKNEAFTPIVPARIETTPPPTAAQIRILRERIDREGILRRAS